MIRKEFEMFLDFLSMVDNYDDRAVDRYEEGDNFVIDTCSVNDAEQPFETGIKHPSYNNGDWVIVEGYDSEDEAKDGHKRWVDIMTADKLPEQLVDIATSTIAKFASIFSGKEDFSHQRKV